MLLQMDHPMSDKDVSLMNVLQIAYIGDAVWELAIRGHLIRKGLNVRHMHGACIRYVSAHAQAAFIQQLMPLLSSFEDDLIRRGRNAHAHHPVPKNQLPEDYSQATAFETLIGYLYLTDQKDRLKQITDRIIVEVEGNG